MTELRLRPVKQETVDSLRVRVYRNRMEMGMEAGAAVAAKIKELLAEKERVRIIFAAAPSQNEMLDVLAADKPYISKITAAAKLLDSGCIRINNSAIVSRRIMRSPDLTGRPHFC